MQAIGKQYELLGEVGRGAMGVVFRAVRKETGAEVAIKILPEEFQSDPNAVRRFWREAKLSNALNHPNIVRTGEFLQFGDQYLIEMEFVDGRNLNQIQGERGDPFHEREVIRVAIPLCDALEYAHGKNIIHRDVKPANVMVDRKGVVKLADFGIAGLFERGRPGYKTYAAATLGYVSPEQLAGERTTPQSDIYSLGATLYSMLWGDPPIDGTDVERIFVQKPDQIPGVSDEMNALLLKCLQKDPQQRHLSADLLREVFVDLQQILG